MRLDWQPVKHLVESGWGKDDNFKSCGGGVKAFNSPTRGEPAFITS